MDTNPIVATAESSACHHRRAKNALPPIPDMQHRRGCRGRGTRREAESTGAGEQTSLGPVGITPTHLFISASRHHREREGEGEIEPSGQLAGRVRFLHREVSINGGHRLIGDNQLVSLTWVESGQKASGWHERVQWDVPQEQPLGKEVKHGLTGAQPGKVELMLD
ncbi:hypothetical protein N7462_003073 [Penicillium macrosclerotiorum]|uniref:uncharacterized protein n=1 Tax=Penicillium macrosclerotiorum TaxID=303699 RepID=UPI0025491FD4|nr:uncharacterized protein N7462_003073 [Penicillium macrosclerotiorum]KAJ5688681.1 hypothetical protein N7462_003073 [Penicillium macrosclerotiorum]